MPIDRLLDVRCIKSGKVGDRITIRNIEFTLVDLNAVKKRKKKSEKPNCVICASISMPLYYPDNRTGGCADCGTTLQWRPDVPDSPKVCLRCGDLRMIGAAKAEGDDLSKLVLITSALGAKP